MRELYIIITYKYISNLLLSKRSLQCIKLNAFIYMPIYAVYRMVCIYHILIIRCNRSIIRYP